MKAKQYSVNEKGLNEIKYFLYGCHKNNYFTPEMLRAWAKDAEFQLSEGSPATIEIPARDAVLGHTETYTISDAGLDCEEIELEE